MNKHLILLGIAVLFICAGLSGCNQLSSTEIQSKMDNTLKGDYRNEGIEVDVYHEGYFDASVLIYDLQSISYDKSRADVFRVFLQFAEEVSSIYFEEVELAYQGKVKFKIDGDYFQQLGEEYSWQNPVYTIRTFPEHLYYPDGTRAYSTWTGGMIGVSTEQMEDFNDFHDRWYLNEILYG